MTDALPFGPRRQHLWQWCLLAVVSLAVAGLFAILLVLSRAPVTSESVPWPVDFFQKGLVAHVALSFAVWFLAVFGAINTAMVSDDTRFSAASIGFLLDKMALFLAATGTLALLIPTFQDQGEPTLNNYIPVIINPIYYAGLVVLAVGILLSVIRVLKNLIVISDTMMDEIPVLMSVGLIYVTAIAALVIAGVQLGDLPLSHGYNEDLVWGAGHILQVMNAGLFLIAVSLLFRRAFGYPLAPPRFFRWIGGLLFLIAIAGLSLYSFFTTGSTENTRAFSGLQFVLGGPVSIILIALAVGLWRQRENFRFSDPGGFSLAAAFTVFTTGALFGLFVDGADTRTPAHYHGVIGGINLVFVGLFYAWLLPLLGRTVARGKLVVWQVGLYAVGQWFFIVGMFAAGGMGASRKVMGAGIDIDTVSALAATGIRDLGGGLAIIGGLMFILIALKALFRQADPMP